MHSAIHTRKLPSPLARAELAKALKAWIIATNSEPKQMDPKLVVTVRMNELHIPLEQNPDSSGATHHVPTVPATVTCTHACSTCCVKNKERNIKNKYP
mmetsp:Transcript_28478/g.31961  ORF Transcript_28478/g.31961 Transcript_28478/m.31961 type:complete len:98 (-) Transcript_28478:802-1095(-)